MMLYLCNLMFSFFFFFNDTATTEIYTLSLHDALPISYVASGACHCWLRCVSAPAIDRLLALGFARSEEHTSELQSQSNLVCRLLLEKKKTNNTIHHTRTTTIPHYHTSTISRYAPALLR